MLALQLVMGPLQLRRLLRNRVAVRMGGGQAEASRRAHLPHANRDAVERARPLPRLLFTLFPPRRV